MSNKETAQGGCLDSLVKGITFGKLGVETTVIHHPEYGGQQDYSIYDSRFEPGPEQMRSIVSGGMIHPAGKYTRPSVSIKHRIVRNK